MPFPIFDFVIALMIGLLVGIEREKKKMIEGETGVAGLRTFILITQAGAVAAYLAIKMNSPWFFFAGATLVTSILLVAGFLHSRTSPQSHSLGLTTEMAGLVVYFLAGAVIYQHQRMAVAMGIITSAVLAYKEPLHGLVTRIGREDIYAGLKLLIATFIVLPVLPDHTIDRWQAINPHKLWLLVILISGLSLVGYIATRWLGNRLGLSLTGLFGGIASSTAVSLSFAKRSHDADVKSIPGILAAGILLSWTVMFIRIIVIVGILFQPMLYRIGIMMGILGLLCALVGLLMVLRQMRAREPGTDGSSVPLKNPFSLRWAIEFALIFAAVLLVVKLVQQHLPGSTGIYVVALLAGLVDVDAITLSMAQFAATPDNPMSTATNAIVIATASNTVVKCAMAGILGTRPLAIRMIVSTILLLATAGIMIVLSK